MHLLCKVCGATQPVNVADEADEDPRTQGIRRSFRSDHLASCGENAVALQLHKVDEAAPIDFTPQPWTHAAPEGVRLNGDGFFYDVTGWRICEDCWQPIPRYIDFPLGLTSPESAKHRAVNLGTYEKGGDRAGLESLSKAVCLPCYLAAFLRVYPHAELPAFRAAVISDERLQRQIVDAHLTTIEAGFLVGPKVA